VIPCFNDGATLGDALRSLHGQEPHELVVVDDGSDETETLRVLAQLESGEIRVVREHNRDLAKARMAGVRATSARYVMPLDADDMLAASALTRLADALDAYPEAAVAWGDVAVFGEIESDVRVAPVLDRWHITYVSEVPGTSMLRREALLDAGGWRPSGGYEDWDLWMTFAETGRTGIYVPGLMIRYRRHAGRLSARSLGVHEGLHAELRPRHELRFERRQATWRSSAEPLRTRCLFPLIGALSFVAPYTKHRLFHLASHPRQLVRLRRLRRRAEARRELDGVSEGT